MCVETCVKISDKSDKNEEITKIWNFFLASIGLKFSKILNRNLKKRTMLRGNATLPLWFEPSHDYVGPAVTEIIYGPEGLIRAAFSAVGLFLGRKLKEFQFYIRMPNFRLLGSIIIKKYPKVADPLKKCRFLFFGCFDLESGRIKLSRPWVKAMKILSQ